MEKEQLRKEIKQRLKTINNKEEREELLEIKIDTNTVLAYIPLPSEVNIKKLISTILKTGKIVAIPTENPTNFAQLKPNWEDSLIELKNKTKTIKTDKTIDITKLEEKTTILVPGLAFSRDGKRLGRGAHFYDTVLQKGKNLYSIGICFKEQLLDQIPTDENDEKVDEIISI